MCVCFACKGESNLRPALFRIVFAGIFGHFCMLYMKLHIKYLIRLPFSTQESAQ